MYTWTRTVRKIDKRNRVVEIYPYRDRTGKIKYKIRNPNEVVLNYDMIPNAGMALMKENGYIKVLRGSYQGEPAIHMYDITKFDNNEVLNSSSKPSGKNSLFSWDERYSYRNSQYPA